MAGLDQNKVDKSVEIWLDSIEDRLEYGSWFCAHYHMYKVIDKMCFLFDEFIEFDLAIMMK
jgi:hypothetical protein